MGTIKADTLTGLADPNKVTLPSGQVTDTTFAMGATLSVGSTTATLNFGNTVIANGSAGSTTVTGEGGSTTTNIQQGLTKTWICLGTDGGNAIDRDSFNVSTIDDDAQGVFTVHHTNNFVATFYSKTTAPFGTTSTGNMVQVIQYQDHSASQAELNAIDEGNSVN